jgi:hypothetical protein
VLVRNPAQIALRLFSGSRPGREELVQKKILKGAQPHQIRSGSYINGPGAQRAHQMQSRLSRYVVQRCTLGIRNSSSDVVVCLGCVRLLKEQSLRKGLRDRPDFNDLEKLGVMPQGVNFAAITSGEKEDDRSAAWNVADGKRTKVVSAALVPRMIHLRKALRLASLNRKLQRRKSVEDVVEAGVLKSKLSVSAARAACHFFSFSTDDLARYSLCTKPGCGQRGIGEALCRRPAGSQN